MCVCVCEGGEGVRVCVVASTLVCYLGLAVSLGLFGKLEIRLQSQRPRSPSKQPCSWSGSQESLLLARHSFWWLDQESSERELR